MPHIDINLMTTITFGIVCANLISSLLFYILRTATGSNKVVYSIPNKQL